MKMEREAKKPSEMVDRRENEASSDQMKADGREIDRASSPFRAGFQKNLANQTSSQKTSLSRSALMLSFVAYLEKYLLSIIQIAEQL